MCAVVNYMYIRSFSTLKCGCTVTDSIPAVILKAVTSWANAAYTVVSWFLKKISKIGATRCQVFRL